MEAPLRHSIGTSHLTFSLHLARRHPRKAVAALVLIAAASIAAGYGLSGPVFGLLAGLLLVASIGDFLFPLHVRLTPEVAEVRGLLHRRRMLWPEVRRVVRDDLGVRLSPFPKPSRLDAYRGIYLWFQGNPEEVMAFIAHHVTAEAAGGDVQSSGELPPAAPG